MKFPRVVRSLGAALTALSVVVVPVVVPMVLASPVSVAAQGLFVVSQQTQQTLHYDESDGTFVETFIDPVLVGYRNPRGFAISPADGNLYISSTGTGEIWRYVTATGVADPPVVATGLFSPLGVAFDSTGANLFVIDDLDDLSLGTDSIKKIVVATGVVSTLATDALADFSAIQILGSEIYVSDGASGQITRYPITGGAATAVVTGLASPGQILFRSSTDMLIAEPGADRVVEYVFSGGVWVFDRVVLSAVAGVDGPFGLAIAPDGRLSVSGQFTNNVVAVDLSTLAVATLVSPRTAGLNGPKDLAWSGSTLLAASVLTNTIIYYDSAGSPTGVRARGISTPADGGMAFSGTGDKLLIGSVADNEVVEFSGNTGAELRIFPDACPSFLAAPFDVAYGPDGNVYISCTAANAVHRFDGATGDPLGFFVISGAGGLSNPHGLAFGPNGNLFTASGGTGDILEFSGTSGAFIGVFVDGLTGGGGGPVDPWGLTFHNGNLFVASRFPSEVKEFNGTTGAFVQTLVTSGSGGLAGPTAVAFGPGGDLYVTSFDDDAIRRYNGNNGAFVEVFVPTGSGGLNDPIDLEFRPSLQAGSVPALSPRGWALFSALFALAWLARFAPRGFFRTAISGEDNESFPHPVACGLPHRSGRFSRSWPPGGGG